MSTRLPVRRNASCQDLAALLLDLKPLDVETYRALLNSRDGGSVKEVADALDRERSSAYRSLERLASCDLAEKESEVRMRKRYYVYRPVNAEERAPDGRGVPRGTVRGDARGRRQNRGWMPVLTWEPVSMVLQISSKRPSTTAPFRRRHRF
ncbi:MAG: hypothetical protein MAG715_00731 [Methanonatronarchaeales archaeon]|nr:hypothetical protein [Methanonatronarchaeales archaeon]